MALYHEIKCHSLSEDMEFWSRSYVVRKPSRRGTSDKTPVKMSRVAVRRRVRLLTGQREDLVAQAVASEDRNSNEDGTRSVTYPHHHRHNNAK